MYYDKPEAKDEVIVYPQVALPFKPEDAEAREGVALNASESKADKKKWSTTHTRLSKVIKPLVLYMKESGTDSIEGVPSTIDKN